MDSFTISVDRGLLAAVAVTAAKDDVRYYLNGIRVETGPKGLFLVASDGHRITVAHAGGEHPSWEGIMPVSFALACAKTKRPAADIQITEQAFNCSSLGIMAPVGEGKYPDWRVAINRTGTVLAPTAAVNINPAYVGDLAKQVKALKVAASEVIITARRYASDKPGTEPASALVQFGTRQDIFAIIMAIRAGKNAPKPGYPEWFTA